MIYKIKTQKDSQPDSRVLMRFGNDFKIYKIKT